MPDREPPAAEARLLRIVNETRGTILAARAEVARSFWRRFRGLMGRRDLPADGGLVIEPTISVHTLGMQKLIQSRLANEQNAAMLERL